MSKQKVVLRKFRCRGHGDDCPPAGFEVVEAKNVALKKHDMLTEGQVDNLKSNKVQVILAR